MTGGQRTRREIIMRVTAVEAFLCDLEVEHERHDAIQSFAKQETIFVDIQTAESLRGRAYSYTIGTRGRAILQMLRTDLCPALLGEDARQIEAIWHKLFWRTHGTVV